MAENTSTNVQESEEEAVVAAASELVNASQAKKCGPVTDTDADTAGEAEEEESDPADTDGQAAAAVPVSAESGQDHRELKDYSYTESGWSETDADQDESAMSNPATTDQSKTENESKSSDSESDRNVNATNTKEVNKVNHKLVKVDPETEAREIFDKFLKRLYGDRSKLVLSASYKKRIIAYLQGQLPIADQTVLLKNHVKQFQYVLVDADKVSKEFITSSGDDSSIIMDSDPDGQGEKQTEKILMRPHYKTKELVPAPSQSEMYDLIKQCHLSTENHVLFEHTNKLLQKKYGCIPRVAVQKFVSMCRVCQMKKGQHTMGQSTPRQLKAKEREKQEKADKREKEHERKMRTDEEKQRRREERKAAAEERKRLKALEATRKRLEREEERKGVAAKESPVKRGKKGEGVAAKKSPVKRGKKGEGVAAKKSPIKRGKKGEGVAAKKSPVNRGKKGEGDAAERSPVKRKASAKDTTTRKKVKVTETKAKTKKSRISPTTLVQYVILPGDVFHAEDLTTNQAVIQACHARTAVLQLFKDDDNVIKYTSDFDAMHTEILETEDEEEMEVISDELKSKNIDHILWMKSATNMATCIATKPYPKRTVHKHFKDLTQFLME